MAIKKSIHREEKLDDASVAAAIKLLEEKATKKDVCARLNISYNVARLDKIIEAYKDKKAREVTKRAEKRGKPATEDEISYVVSEYINGATISSISETLYRGSTFIHAILDKFAIPLRSSSQDYFKPELIPDEAARDRFSVGETVYSARYESLATIRNELKQKDGYVYGIFLTSEKWREYAYQPAWELASLSKLKDMGIKL